jgi:hypothetical protein
MVSSSPPWSFSSPDAEFNEFLQNLIPSSFVTHYLQGCYDTFVALRRRDHEQPSASCGPATTQPSWAAKAAQTTNRPNSEKDFSRKEAARRAFKRRVDRRARRARTPVACESPPTAPSQDHTAASPTSPTPESSAPVFLPEPMATAPALREPTTAPSTTTPSEATAAPPLSQSQATTAAPLGESHAARESSSAPAARDSTPAPAARESTPAPAARESSPAPAARESTPAPAARESTPAPAARESTPAPAAREPSPAPAAAREAHQAEPVPVCRLCGIRVRLGNMPAHQAGKRCRNNRQAAAPSSPPPSPLPSSAESDSEHSDENVRDCPDCGAEVHIEWRTPGLGPPHEGFGRAWGVWTCMGCDFTRDVEYE